MGNNRAILRNFSLQMETNVQRKTKQIEIALHKFRVRKYESWLDCSAQIKLLLGSDQATACGGAKQKIVSRQKQV